jgi:hypothetical protein
MLFSSKFCVNLAESCCYQVRTFASTRFVRTSTRAAAMASGANGDADACGAAGEGCEEETCAELVPEAVRIYVQVTANVHTGGQIS